MGRAELSAPRLLARPFLFGLHAAALAALALALWTSDRLASSAYLLAAHRLDRLDVVLVALFLCPLLPPGRPAPCSSPSSSTRIASGR